MISAAEIVSFRERIGFCQGHVARYLDWPLGLLIAYENGRPLTPQHEAQMAKMMGVDHAPAESTPAGLQRRFTSGGRAGPSEVELMEAYAQVGKNPAYDSSTRELSMTRYRMLEALFRRQPKAF